MVVNTTLKYGLVRMYEIQAELNEIVPDTHVFYDLQDAVEWLGEQAKVALSDSV